MGFGDGPGKALWHNLQDDADLESVARRFADKYDAEFGDGAAGAFQTLNQIGL